MVYGALDKMGKMYMDTFKKDSGLNHFPMMSVSVKNSKHFLIA